MHLVFIWTLFTLSSYSVAAQDLKPPTIWRSPNVLLVQSKENCTTTARKALKEAINRLDWADGQFSDGRYADAGALYAQMVELDRLTNQTRYKDMLKHYFKAAESKKPSFLDRQLQAGLNYGYAAARAYTTYQDPDFLTFAATSWASARLYTISSEQAASRTIETKQFTLASCNGTLAGGTYFNTDSKSPNIDSLATGMFLVVSALLAEATKNQMYIDAAKKSAHFIQSQLLNVSDHTVWTSIRSNSNRSSSCPVNLETSPCGSGTFIEGLAILAASGIKNDAQTKALLTSTVHAVTSNSLWQGADGVYKYDNDHSIGGHCIVRALASLYECNKTSSDLQAYIKEYISVQYNSVINHARSPKNPNIYVSPWTGSLSTLFNSIEQTSALTVLLGAIQLVDGQSSSSSSIIPASSVGTSLRLQPSLNSSVIPTSSGGTLLPSQLPPTSSVNPDNSSGPASSAKKDLTGIIAGSVIGGIVLLTTLITVTLFLRKLHRQRSDNPSVVEGSSLIVTPFTATQSMASSGILGEQHQRTRVKSARFRVPGIAMGEEPSSRATDNGLVGIPGTNVLTELMAIPRTQVASPENPLPGNRREHTLLEELLRSINDRMSRDRWNAEEMPPGYHEG